MFVRRFFVRPSRRLATLLAGAALAASATGSFAGPSPAGHRPAAAGLLIGIDEAGRIGMPDAAQRARLAERSAKTPALTAARPAPVRHANGSISMDVRSWMREFSVARSPGVGQSVLGCVAGPDAAVRALREKLPPAPASGAEDR